jgi:hypothetical protein
LRKQEVVADKPSEFPLGKNDSFHVRFSFPQLEVSAEGPSRRLQKAQQSIVSGIQSVTSDIRDLPRSDREELSEPFRNLPASNPIGLHLITDPTPEDLTSGTGAAYTMKKDGQIKIQFPTDLTTGKIFAAGKTIQVSGTRVKDLIKRTIIHEFLHALLIRKKIDSDSVAPAMDAGLRVKGDPETVKVFNTLARNYLTAQEEIFAYENEGRLYQPASPAVEKLKTWKALVEGLFAEKNLLLEGSSHRIALSDAKAAKGHGWQINYTMPSGDINVSHAQLAKLSALNTSYRIAVAPEAP